MLKSKNIKFLDLNSNYPENLIDLSSSLKSVSFKNFMKLFTIFGNPTRSQQTWRIRNLLSGV